MAAPRANGSKSRHWRNQSVEFLVLRQRPRDAKSFAKELRRVPNTPDAPAARQFVARVAELAIETEIIRERERQMNETLYGLYRLSDQERLLVEKDHARRPLL